MLVTGNGSKKLKHIYKITHAVSSHSVQLKETMGFKIMYSLRNHIKSLLRLIEVGATATFIRRN